MKAIVLHGLKQIPFFINLSGEALNALADKAKPVKFAKGEVIITEGEQTQSLYIVISGDVKVLTHYGENKNVDLVILEPYMDTSRFASINYFWLKGTTAHVYSTSHLNAISRAVMGLFARLLLIGLSCSKAHRMNQSM
jgi:hypothetical protein